MKKLLRITAWILLITLTVGTVYAQTAGFSGGYDPVSEGIVSAYYQIDKERGYILGVAPGTTAEQLKNVCIPGNLTVSGNVIGTGTVVTATVEIPQPEPTVPETTVPETTIPETTVPETTVPETTVPETTVPETTVPETTVPETTVPETTVPETTVPETTVPETTVPETTVPETTVPETTVPETTVPETTVPETTVPETTVPETTVPETMEAEQQTGAFSLRSFKAAPETVTHSLTVIVTGDLNGDGKVTISDMLMVKSSVLGDKLSNVAAAAGDLNRDGKVTITDFLKVKSYLLGLETINAGSAAPASESILLMTPNSSQRWNVAATAYASENTAVATVDANGTVVARANPGSTFVYALDGDGNVLERVMVTVLNEKLTVSLGRSSCTLIKGQTETLTPTFNHPVTADVSWSSSENNIVTVDANGKLTAKNFGSAKVTATLANGSNATVTVKVVPPIESMTFGKTLYKVKPGKTVALGLQVKPADSGEEILYSSSDTNIAVANADGSVTGVSYGTVTITATGKYSGKKTTCQVKVCDVKQVALTFDDGPSTHTVRLLDYLKEKGVKVTFFMVGNRIGRYPNTVKRMADEGHELGYHSYSHQQQTALTTEQITGDFNRSNQELVSIAGRGYTLWRTPGGGYNDRVLQAVPVPHIYWSVDTLDWKYRDVNYVRDAIMNKSKDGSIVLLHDLHGTSVDGAIKAIEQMLAGDYEFLTVTEILSRDGTPPQPSVNYYNG